MSMYQHFQFRCPELCGGMSILEQLAELAAEAELRAEAQMAAQTEINNVEDDESHENPVLEPLPLKISPLGFALLARLMRRGSPALEPLPPKLSPLGSALLRNLKKREERSRRPVSGAEEEAKESSDDKNACEGEVSTISPSKVETPNIPEISIGSPYEDVESEISDLDLDEPAATLTEDYHADESGSDSDGSLFGGRFFESP